MAYITASEKKPAETETGVSLPPFALDGTAAEAWLQCLATLAFSDACRHLFSALHRLNHSDLSAHQRFQWLELLHTQITKHSHRFAPYFIEQTFPLDDKVRKIARLAMQFQRELAHGYQQLTDSPACATAFNPQQQATAVHRTLTAYDLYLLRSAQCYELPGVDAWQNIYRVYRHAEIMGITETQVFVSNASKNLCKMALFHLAQPTRLAQYAMSELHTWLDRHAHLISLQHERACNLQEAAFYLDLSTSLAPQSIDTLVVPHGEIRYLFLDAELLELLQTSSQCAEFGPVVARQLAPRKDGWQSHEPMQPVMFASGVEGCAGLVAVDLTKVSYQLHQQGNTVLEIVPIHKDARSTLSARVAQRFNNDPIKPTQVSRDEIWGKNEPAFIAAHCSNPGLVRFYQNNSRATLITDHQHVHIGQLLAMSTDQLPPAIGVVRAVTPTLDVSRVGADIEIITGDVTTAHTYLINEKRQRFSSLLITEEDAAGKPLLSILLPMLLSNGTWIVVEQQDRWRNLRLAHLLEAGENFYSYRLLSAE